MSEERKTVRAGVPAQIVGGAYLREKGRVDFGALQRGFDALSAAGWVVVPRKLLRKAHACMRESGWHLAMAAEVHGDGALEAAVSEVEEGFATLLSAAPEAE